MNGGSLSARGHSHSPSRRQDDRDAQIVTRDGTGLVGELAAVARQQDLKLHKHRHHANILSLGEIGKQEERHIE